MSTAHVEGGNRELADTKPYLMCVLMHASLDYSRAMLKILKDDPVGFCAVGPALLRPQIETFIRAGWIYFNADEAQVKEFLRNDKLRRQKNKGAQKVSSSNPFDGENLDDFLDRKNTMSISAIEKALEGKLGEKGLAIDLAAYVKEKIRCPRGCGLDSTDCCTVGTSCSSSTWQTIRRSRGLERGRSSPILLRRLP